MFTHKLCGEGAHAMWHMCEVRGQLGGIHSLLPSCVFGGLNSGYQTWQQASLLTEACVGLLIYLLIFKCIRVNDDFKSNYIFIRLKFQICK